MVCRVSDILDHQIVWIRELPELLMTGEKHQSFHQVIILPKDIKIIQELYTYPSFCKYSKVAYIISAGCATPSKTFCNKLHIGPFPATGI